MKWRGRRGSANVEDRRGAPSARGGFGPGIRIGRGGGGFPGGFPGGGGGGRRRGGGGVGLLGIVAIVVVAALLGVNPMELLGPQTGGGFAPGEAPRSAPAQLSQAEREAGEFVSVVLADTEEVWDEVFRDELGRDYAAPVLVLFSGATTSPCGQASAATGPFYCPLDRKVYLDTDFFVTLRRQLGAGGDFAQACVVAHEVGHHVQNELGLLEKVQRAKARMTGTEAAAVSVRTELMADCLAGLWTARAEERFGILEPGDVEEAMNAAARIGDDALQGRAGGRVRPETFTHGTSAQRQRWFATAYETGRLSACDTFAVDRL